MLVFPIALSRRNFQKSARQRTPEKLSSWNEHSTPSVNDLEREFAAIWKALPKVVFSSTLSTVQGSNTRLASGGLAEEIEKLRAEPGEGNIGIGGATLAAEVAELGLIDEYRARVLPVLVGGGISFFPQREQRANLELVETRTFTSKVVFLHYRVVR